MNVLANPNFESPMTGGQVPGWLVLNQRAAGAISLTPEGAPGGKPAGKQALTVRSDSPKGSFRSITFDIPRSRRATVTVWLKVPDANQQPPVQLVIEDSQDYRRAGAIGAYAVDDAFRIPEGWKQFAFPVNDLPNDGSRQIRFGL